MYSNADQFFFLQGCELKAATMIMRKYKVNRHELQILSALSACLQLSGKKACSRRTLMNWLGVSYALRGKCEVYLDWLVKKGCLSVVTYKNKKVGHSLGLSVYGGNVLEAFYNEVERIESVHVGRKKLPGYKDLVFTAENVPAGYSMNIAGREN